MRTMSILFSDVRGFTTISETYKRDPQGLTQLMNRFLTPMTNAIIDHKGTIDKYMGDAIMAFWNAPIDDADHEINACRAAIDMLARVEALKPRERFMAFGAAAVVLVFLANSFVLAPLSRKQVSLKSTLQQQTITIGGIAADIEGKPLLNEVWIAQ